MHLEERVSNLLKLIEEQEYRWKRVEGHPAYSRFAGEEPALRESVGRLRGIFARLQDAVYKNDPRVLDYLDQIEESVHYLRRDVYRLYKALGYAAPTLRVLN